MQTQYEVMEPHGEQVLSIEPLLAAHTIILSTHVNPDGDGLGAGLALMRGLRSLGKDVRIYLDAPIPERYEYLDRDSEIMVADAIAADFIRDADLFVALDTNDLERTGQPYSMRGDAPVCVIDHHLGDVPDHVFMICDTDSSSTGEIVYRILVQAGVAIPPEIGNLTNLVILTLSDNDLIGDLPSEIGNLTNLSELNLDWNDLTGELPPEIGNLTELTYLRLHDNQVSGEIPSEIGSLTQLINLTLSRNNLTGSLPLR